MGSLEEIVADEGSTKDELTPSVESSLMALLESDDNQAPRPNFEIEFEPSPKTPEPNQDQEPSPEPSPSPEPEPEKLDFEQNPEPEPELNTTQESIMVTNLLSSQAQLLAPNFINPTLQPSPSTATPMSPNQSQNLNPSNNKLMTPTAIGSPSVPKSISHFNTLAANAQPPTRRNSMSAPNEFKNFMRKSFLSFEKKLDDFITDNQNTTRTLAGHAETLTSHGITLASVLTAQEKIEQDLNSLKQQNTALTQDLAQQSIKVTQLEKTIDDLIADKVDVQSVLKDMDDLRSQK